MSIEITDDRVYLEVIGGGAKGESILVRLPTGHWGVVDCYGSLTKPSKHAIIQRLKQLNVAELEFVALTHPHDDHYRGMSLLLEEFPPKRFWQFTGTNPYLMEFLIQYLPAEARNGPSETLKSSTDDLIKTYRVITERARKGEMRRDYLCGINQLINIEVGIDGTLVPLKMTSFAPNGTVVTQYEAELSRCFGPDRVLEKLADHPLDHNRLSVGFVIQFGDSRLVLGGDILTETWQRVIAGDPLNPQNLAANVVKVSHHGSTTGYCDDLWSTLSRQTKPVAVITPWFDALPHPEALKHIREHASKVVLTGLPSNAAARFAGISIFPSEVTDLLDADSVPSPVLGTHGRCSMTIDHLGSVIDIELVDGAGYLS